MTVLHNADRAAPGQWVNISVVPQIVQQPLGIASELSGTLTGAVAGSLTGTASSILETARLKVGYEVTRDNTPVDQRDVLSVPADVSLTPSEKQNQVNYLLRPPIVDSTIPTEPFHYKIRVTVEVSVTVGGTPKSFNKVIDIPVDLPSLDIPAVMVLCNRADLSLTNPRGVAFSVIVRRGSALPSLGTAVQALRAVNSTLQSLNTLLEIGSFFFSELETVAKVISDAPLAYLHETGDRDTEQDELITGEDLDDNVQSVILVGTTGTSARMFRETDYEDRQRDVVAREVGNFSLVGLFKGTFTGDDDRATESTLILPAESPSATAPGDADISVTARFARDSHIVTEVINNGPDTATGVVVDVSEHGLPITLPSASQGVVADSRSDTALQWGVGNLRPGATAQLTVTYERGRGDGIFAAEGKARQFDANLSNNKARISLPG
ncbi:hypothetical protein ACWDSL_33355 [Streptomyces sp. NPDC000941]